MAIPYVMFYVYLPDGLKERQILVWIKASASVADVVKSAYRDEVCTT